jgi:hypothetical protein
VACKSRDVERLVVLMILSPTLAGVHGPNVLDPTDVSCSCGATGYNRPMHGLIEPGVFAAVFVVLYAAHQIGGHPNGSCCRT